MTAVLHVRNLSLGYPHLTLFRQLSLNVEAGTTLAVLGENGSGKSTFVKSLLGLIPPLSGKYIWPDGRPDDIIRVRDLVAMGAWRGFGLWSGLDRTARSKVDAALAETGVLALADRPLFTLSGGQLQRTLFARVML